MAEEKSFSTPASSRRATRSHRSDSSVHRLENRSRSLLITSGSADIPACAQSTQTSWTHPGKLRNGHIIHMGVKKQASLGGQFDDLAEDVRVRILPPHVELADAPVDCFRLSGAGP